uniref:Retropepsins domain-containing protein n=1 Tax=Vitis vinifera TaxID=29760 RepID=A5B383_VITVI|nr:hypothetical protein VITISV_036745 [Vitis vinifera]
MIQVAAKSLTRLGLNTSIVMCLRDNRHLNYRDSIIGAIQVGLNDDPVYFQRFPYFTVRLRDADILDSVVLHVKTYGFKFKEGDNPVSIITRFAYKNMTTSVGSGAQCTSPKGETTLFHFDMLDKSNFIIPKKIKWSEVEFPENWHFAYAVPAIEQKSERIEQIVQYPDGGGDLIFSNSFRHYSSPRISDYEPSRASSSSIPIEKNINGTIVKASPFKTKPKDKGTASAADIRRIMEQNNYTNMFLMTLGNQLNRVEEIIETQDHIKNSFVKNDNKPLFKPFEFSKKFQENPHIDEAFIDRISQKVKDSLVILKTPLPSHRRINLVKKNVSSKTKVNGQIKIVNEPSNQTAFKIEDHCDNQPKTINVLSQEQKLVLDTLTIKDFQEEIRQYKKEIKDLRQPASLGFFTLHDQINRVGFYHSDPNQEDSEEVLESSQVNNEEINAYLNTISRVIFQGWEVSLTIVIKNKFIFDIVALIDLGAALNCLQEGLIPIKFYKKTKQTLFGANGKRLAIRYKLSNAHICNQDICIKQTFILVKDLKEKTLLGAPFLSTIYLMRIDNHGIRTRLLEKEILFKFANPPGERNINTLRDQLIQAKENHVNLLK